MFATSKNYIDCRCGLHLIEYQKKDPNNPERLGIIDIKGKFMRGDVISVINANNEKIAIGVIAYDYHEAKKIIGKNSKNIKHILGYEGRDELIHKDDLVKMKI